MKKITYSSHLEFRVKLRNIPYLLPRQIYITAKERYFDLVTRKHVAVKRAMYKGKNREFLVAYEEGFDQVTLITIHPLKFHQKYNRIKSRRWRKL